MDRTDWTAQRERLFDAPCWVIDYLPRRVPAESAGPYFAVEHSFRTSSFQPELYRRFARLILKLNCYYDFAVSCLPGNDWVWNPAPSELEGWICSCAVQTACTGVRVLLPTEDAMLTLDAEDLYLVLYQPQQELLETVSALVASEGLFLRKAEES